MPNWTREHDAHIARECEGLEVKESHFDCNWTALRPGEAIRFRLPYYLDDANARDRAAEAWRKKKEGRYWVLTSAGHGMYNNGDVARATLYEDGPWVTVVAVGDGENALLQALYRATVTQNENRLFNERAERLEEYRVRISALEAELAAERARLKQLADMGWSVVRTAPEGDYRVVDQMNEYRTGWYESPQLAIDAAMKGTV